MFEKYTLAQIISFLSVGGAAAFRIIYFNRMKKQTATKEGREYVATKGGVRILSLDAMIFLSVIILVAVSALKINLAITIILQVVLWVVGIVSQIKLLK